MTSFRKYKRKASTTDGPENSLLELSKELGEDVSLYTGQKGGRWIQKTFTVKM